MKGSILVICALALFPALGKAASFECEKSRSPLEKAVCGDDYLSSLDSEVGRFYRTARQRPDLRADQRQWNKENAGQCFPADDRTARQCLVRRYEERRLFLLDIVRGEALEKAPETWMGPYSFRQVAFQFSDSNKVSYIVLSKQPADVADAFNRLVVPSDKEFLNLCDDQSFEERVELVTDRIVTVRTDFWMYCEGAAHGYGSNSGKSIMMLPKPHLVEAADLFRPDSPWQQRLIEACVETVRGETDLGPEEEKMIHESAPNPRNWLVEADALIVQFGYLNGYAGGEIQASVPWSRLDGLLVADPPFAPQ